MASESKKDNLQKDIQVMEDDNMDLTTVMEIESSGDPKRDKVGSQLPIDSSFT